MKKVYDNDLQDKSTQITFLPTDKIISELALLKGNELINSLQEKIQHYPKIIANLNNLDYIGEIILFCVNYVASLKESKEKNVKEELIQQMIGIVLLHFADIDIKRRYVQ